MAAATRPTAALGQGKLKVVSWREPTGDVARVLVVIWSRACRLVSSRVPRGVVVARRRELSGNCMYDAHAALLLFLEWLHEDLNVAPPSMRPGPIPEVLGDQVAAVCTWRGFDKVTDSISMRLYGQQKYDLLNAARGHRSLMLKTFTLLSLPLASCLGESSQNSIHHYLQLYVHGYLISDWTCSNRRRRYGACRKWGIRLSSVAIF